MKVLLISPPYMELYGATRISEGVTPPLGIMYIASILEKNDIDVSIIDGDASSLTWKKLAELIKKESPDIVGITSTTPTIKQVHKTARIAKYVKEDTIVVIGGIHASTLPEETLLPKEVDIVIRGEADYITLQLVKSLENGKSFKDVLGISYKENGRFIHNPPAPLIDKLDDLPFPAHHLINQGDYRLPITRKLTRHKFTVIISSRGCPYQCIFCATRNVFGNICRFRSPKNTVDEIEFVLNKLNVKEILFYDDTFTLNIKRAIEICNEIIERGLDFIWQCGSRVDRINREILSKLYKAGCRRIGYGIESGSQEILNRIKKGITLDQARKSIKLTKEMGISVLASFMFGHPGETLKTAEATIKFAKELNPDWANFFVATPFPGTELYEYAKSKGLIQDTDWSKYLVFPDTPLMETDELSGEMLLELHKRAYKEFYLRSNYLISRFARLVSLSEFIQILKGGITYTMWKFLT
ncbi:radical SAM protein [Candidatus Borrarchaeum sp.]|uniref:B12-binding domain-containing radical SAM protein n=1 Tax=Candidatus Borrarchaeum sp. TaxID=2846742 RepID=UPI00257C1088|nr:radical SAM protein [Candidatus Borrarchaeum sp.]